MQNRVPVSRAERPALPAFTPVPRKCNRHDGWTPARQVAFIHALADTGSVRRAAAMVNMSQANAYALRRAPGAEEFRRAWDAALDFGLARLKDLAFERAIEGELSPVFVGGKLMGFQRKHNNALLMFCLRHYGQDANGKRTTINYFSSKAVAGTASGAGGDAGGTVAGAEASTTTVRTVIAGGAGGAETLALNDDRMAAALNGFQGVTLDDAATAAIRAALEECAARARAADAAYDAGGDVAAEAAADDPAEPFVRLGETANPYLGALEPVFALEDEEEPFAEGEPDWRALAPEPAAPKPAALPAPRAAGRPKVKRAGRKAA